MNPKKTRLEDALVSWNPAADRPPATAADVWRQIGRQQERSARTRALGVCAVACLAAGLAFAHWRVAAVKREAASQFARQYLELIDPLLELRADSLEAELGWIRSDLNLDAGQFARIEALHRSAMGRLAALNEEVQNARAEVARLEEKRRTQDEVDFVAYARLTETQRTVNRECRESTGRLIQASAAVMTPTQRRRYLQYVHPALEGSP